MERSSFDGTFGKSEEVASFIDDVADARLEKLNDWVQDTKKLVSTANTWRVHEVCRLEATTIIWLVLDLAVVGNKS